MSKLILALDQGTTSSRAILVTQQGEIVASAQKEFKQIFPQPGWVEHDPEEIWSSQMAVIASLDVRSVAAVGITNQRETTIVWDRKSGEPVYNAIVWQDRRTTEACAKLKEFEPLFQKKTGLFLDPYFSGTKIAWILKHVPGVRERAKRGELCFGTVDSWLIWKLTNGEVHVTDVTNASRTLLFNIHTLTWDEELLKILDIPESMLPKVVSSSEKVGMTKTPLLSAPICGIAGDQQAALIGQLCFEEGQVKTTYGTGCFLLMNTGKKPILSKNKLLTTIAYQIGKDLSYALEGSVFIGGAVVQWLRDNLGIIKTSRDVEKLAASVSGTDGVYFVPAFTGLGAPHWDPHVRGTIFGLTRGTKSAHIARSALEAIAFQVTDVIAAMEADSKITTRELRVDGGVVRSDLLMQFQADLLNVPVLRPKVIELTALGAAYLAGLSIGINILSAWHEEKRFTPSMPRDVARKKINRWHFALKCAKGWTADESN
jgi:glycerol kinase